MGAARRAAGVLAYNCCSGHPGLVGGRAQRSHAPPLDSGWYLASPWLPAGRGSMRAISPRHLEPRY